MYITILHKQNFHSPLDEWKRKTLSCLQHAMRVVPTAYRIHAYSGLSGTVSCVDFVELTPTASWWHCIWLSMHTIFTIFVLYSLTGTVMLPPFPTDPRKYQ
jgi:hypothetical protein